MLDWIFKYKVAKPGAAGSPAPAGDKPAAKPASPPAAKARDGGKQTAATAPAAPAAPAVDWAARLRAALGDDAALLALAREAASPLQTKLDAVAALAGEEALKSAEHDLRSHNRRVHSLAKQRLQALRAQREARAQAARLIDAAQALAGEAQIPVNSAVDLDRAWSALDSTLLLPEQRERYAALTAELSALTRQRADHEASLKLWQASAQQVRTQLQSLCTQTASGEVPPGAWAEARLAAQALAEAAPAGADTSPLLDAMATAAALVERVELLEKMQQQRQPQRQQPRAPRPPEPDDPPEPNATTASAPEPMAPSVNELAPEQAMDAAPAADAPAEPEPTAADPAPPFPAAETQAPAEATAAPLPAAEPRASQAASPSATPSAAQQWQALPPLPDSRLQALLQARFEAWQRSLDDARQQQKAQRREQAKEQKQAVRTERAGALEAALLQAEARLAEGLVAETHKHLIEIDELLHEGAPAGALRTRIELLHSGYAELRGWQHWAGGRARDELAHEAEALAASCAPGPDGQPPKLGFKPHADAIDKLRARWKELDRLGGASSRALWQRFDSALKRAYEPLAAMKAAQSSVREQNLAARRQLLDALEAVPMPADAEAADNSAGLRPALAALDHFRLEWRKLGPVEHTVPRKEQERLMQRMEAAVQRLHAPVDAARQGAQQERRQLIERAQALAAFAQSQQDGAPAGPAARGPRMGPGTGRDLVGEVRNLQGQWQQCAQALPLPRKIENELWTQFRTALDAVFSAREAAFSARDAEFKANADARVALIERLEALGEASAQDTKRTLAEVDTQWQRCGPAPRAQAGALDDRFRRARDAAVQWLAGSRQRSWHASCDALAAKLALCEAHESGAAAAGGLAQAWAALPALPTAWETALQQRAGLVPASAPLSATPRDANADEVLLQLEAAWNLPSPPDFAAARRELQLRAMKAALETRRAASAAANLSPDQWLAEALRRPAAQAAQRERLLAVLSALRQRGPSGATAA